MVLLLRSGAAALVVAAAAGEVLASASSSSPGSTYQNGTTLTQPVFRTLDLGSIKPLGWFKDQLELAAAGLSGNMFDFYRFVHDSRYIGGSTEYSGLDEASPYWFNGVVPLAFGLGDARLLGQARYYLDYVLDHQQPDGWIGFETTRATRGLWARCLLLLGLVQYAEADPAQTERIVDAMHRYVVLAHSMLKNNFTGLLVHGNDTFDTAGFGVGRTHEMHIPLQWLLERYPRNNSQVIWETMELMIEGGVLWGADWRTFWTEEAFPKVLYDTTPYNLSWVFIHGVNMAQGLRYPLALYRNTGDPALRRQTRKAVDLVSAHHRSLAGTIVADEYVSDRNPSRGAELCIAAEVMFSAAYVYHQLGDNDVADWAEQVAFNAFPASVAPDWWSHQYVQQENQPWARNLSTNELWWDVDSYANVFGLEPNYPCCTVNHPQAYPKFLAGAFVATDGGAGLAHVFLVPGSAGATLAAPGGGSNAVSVSADTTYPFGDTITYTVSAEQPFDLYVRIPGWADAGRSSVSVSPSSSSSSSSSPPVPVSRDARGLHRIPISPPAAGNTTTTTTTTATLRLATAPRVVPRANGTAGIYYGALLYALAVEPAPGAPARSPLEYRAGRPLPPETLDAGGRARDHELVPRDGAVWNVAVDPRRIRVVPAPGGGDGDPSRLPNPVWSLGAPPLELRVAAVEIGWPVVRDAPADPGTFDVVRAPGAAPFEARFVPYGSSKLHMALLPVVELDDDDEIAGLE
ncbi:hypothetical protein GGS23DRAFT_615109 [Durotheca rogersii]|uniref:uncharacterized protein n=1 Tax=Durotheca rogersii TaxID=419775 RepID=UPI002220E41F|nr:uncharacterized protein GGS23DRAFT_615109 [Durotheca rogersii]KAI5866575.1 hypothetical protein GGS23DRAFT_615109 [Durotheca rogersii]